MALPREHKGEGLKIVFFGANVWPWISFTFNQEMSPLTFTIISIYPAAFLFIFVVHFRIFVSLGKSWKFHESKNPLNFHSCYASTILFLLVMF